MEGSDSYALEGLVSDRRGMRQGYLIVEEGRAAEVGGGECPVRPDRRGIVLMDTAGRIRVAQESRLGYGSFRKSLDHMGDLVSLVFLRAWRKGDKVYTALESRGYDGSLTTLSAAYTGGGRVYAWGAAAAALQVVTLLLERRLLP